MKKILFTIILILIILPVSLSAQNNPTAVLEYFEDPYGEMIITNEIGNALEYFDMGEILPPGFSISTGGGFAEIRLHPNGTIVKLAENTDFSINNLQGFRGSPSNEFTLLSGKIRTIAARTTGSNYYNVRTPTAVMGVRGTDFINEVGETVSKVVVRKGQVEVIPFSGSSLMVSQNQTVNTLDSVMQAVGLPQEQINALFRSMSFTALSPADVPGHSPLPPGEEGDEGPDAPVETAKVTEVEMEDATQNDALRQETQRKDSKLAGILRNFFAVDIGTTTIDGNTYSKVIIQPTIDLGKFKMGFYLPVIYVDNLLDPTQYYKPRDNDEWSFGTDQPGNFEDVALDILRDIMLKIKYIEYGDQGWDPFYLKVGNLNNMSIGHGTIMNNYANDTEFPAIRKVGINTGFNLGKIGMEFVSDDLAAPSIAGTRLSVNPFSSYDAFQIGLSGIADFYPARSVENSSDYGDPWLLAFGFDVEFLKINRGDFKMKLFGDISSMMPVFREAVNLNGITFDAGIAPGLWLEDSALKNFGVVAGLRGSLFKFTWALEYRLSNGVYKPSMFNALYDRNKISYLGDVIEYLNSPSNYGTVMGLYGEGGYSIKNKMAFTVGYYWPWEINNGSISFSGDDMLSLNIIFMRGLIPRFPIHGSITFERAYLIDTIKGNGNLSLGDGNTVFHGELIYPIAPTLDIAVGVSTVITTDGNGNVIMISGTDTPDVAPVISIETRIHF